MREHELVIKLGNKGSLTIPSQDQFGTGNLFLTVPSPAGCGCIYTLLSTRYLHTVSYEFSADGIFS